MAECSQCGKTAIMDYDGVKLCVDCNLKFVQAEDIKQQQNMRILNHLADSIEAQTGVYGVVPRYQLPTPIVQQAHTWNNIRIDRSVIGAVNTGQITKLDIAMSGLKQAGAEDLAQNVAKLTEAVLQAIELNDQAKNDVMEQLNFLLVQISTPKEHQQHGMIRAALKNLKDTLETISSLASLWNQLQSLLGDFFNA
jgi:hypothetical protein